MTTEQRTAARPRRSATGGLLALGLTLATAHTGSAAQAPAVMPAKATAPAFNAADYELAWQAFLGAGKLDDAVALAEQALLTEPDSVLWHHRLASAAEQNSDAALAARQYAWLVMQGQQAALLLHAIDLAIGTHQNDTALQLMQWRASHESFNVTHWDQLIASMLDGGQLDPALALLERADRTHPSRYFLQQQFHVLTVAGRADAAAALLRRIIARYGNDPQTNLQLAGSEYVQGHLEQALATLQAAQTKATPNDTAYWQTLGALAWMLQDFRAAEHASQVLVRAGKAQAADYSRLYRIFSVNAPAVAYAYALIGWRQTRAPSLFFAAAAAAGRLDQVALQQLLFDSVRAEDRAAMEAQPEFWVQWAQLAQREGHEQAAISRYGHALRLAPGDVGTFAGYLWLLIDTQHVDLLRPLIQRIGPQLPASNDLREAMTSALALLDQPGRALALMQPQLAAHSTDADWLAPFADLLDQADQPEAAQSIRRTALAALHQQPRPKQFAAARRRREARIALTTRLAPGDPARQAIAALAKHPDDTPARELVLAWTMGLDSPEASALWLGRQYATLMAPGWARLSQSLATDNDTQTMQLLMTQAGSLPRRDRVSAAEKLGWKPLALTLAYAGLQGEPDDRQLAMQFQNLALSRADSISTTENQQRGGGLRSLDSALRSTTWLAPAWSLEAEAHHVVQQIDDSNLLGTVPGHAVYASATLIRHQPRREAGISLGGGSNLASYSQLGAFYRYQWRPSLQLGLHADLGARVTDTVPLSLVGLTDQLKGTASYQWSAWDSFSATATIGRLRAQGGGALGNKQSMNLEYRHKLWLAPPDFSVFATATDSRYQPASTLPEQVLGLLPVGQPADIGLLVPRSFAQICLGAGFNENYLEDWSGRLRLFGSASACHNSVSGAGAAVDAGLATPLIGSDHLSFGLGYSSNTGASGSRTLNVLLNYRYYFTP